VVAQSQITRDLVSRDLWGPPRIFFFLIYPLFFFIRFFSLPFPFRSFLLLFFLWSSACVIDNREYLGFFFFHCSLYVLLLFAPSSFSVTFLLRFPLLFFSRARRRCAEQARRVLLFRPHKVFFPFFDGEWSSLSPPSLPGSSSCPFGS